jgi:cystathionine beta-lyase
MYDFDRLIDRRTTGSIKWQRYPQEVLPLWVADMDFPAPAPVRAALQRCLDHGVFGYEAPSRRLAETVAARLERLYGWKVDPQAVIATPGVIAGFSAAARTVCAPGEGVVVQPPVYPPFLKLDLAGLTVQHAPLRRADADGQVHYALERDAFRGAFHSGAARSRMFLLCNPHNPTGQVYSRAELEFMVDTCLGEEAILCSDEIHSELLLGEARHLPAATLSPGIEMRSITLIAPSKTFNVPGLFCAFAIVPDESLRRRFAHTAESLAMHINSLGLAAAEAAFSGECDDWLAALRSYLTANRNFLFDFVRENLPGVRMTLPQATYLAWLDCGELQRSGRISGTPYQFFLKQAKVALNEGREFGPGGENFVRLNFGCPRATLEQALLRIQTALGI